MLVRYINVCFKMSLFLTFWGLVVLAPVYGNAQESNFSWNKYTLANIPNDPSAHQLWVPAVFAYIFSTYFCHLMYGEYRNFVTKRIQYLVQGDGDTPTQTYYTLMVEKVPITLRSAPALETFFENLFPNDIHSVEVALDLKDLDMMTDQRRRVRDNLEKSIALYKATGKLQKEWVKKDFHQECYPLIAVSDNWIARIFGYIIVDAIDHRTRVLAELNSIVKTLQIDTFEQRQKLDEQETKRKQNIHGKIEAHVGNKMRKMLNMSLPYFLSDKNSRNESQSARNKEINAKIKKKSNKSDGDFVYDDGSKCASLLSRDCLLSPSNMSHSMDYDHAAPMGRASLGLNCLGLRHTCFQYESEEGKHSNNFPNYPQDPSINPIRNSSLNPFDSGMVKGIGEEGKNGSGRGERGDVRGREGSGDKGGRDRSVKMEIHDKDEEKNVGSGRMKEEEEEEERGRGPINHERERDTEKNVAMPGKCISVLKKEISVMKTKVNSESYSGILVMGVGRGEGEMKKERREEGNEDNESQEKQDGKIYLMNKDGNENEDGVQPKNVNVNVNVNENENANENENENENEDEEHSMNSKYHAMKIVKSIINIGKVIGMGFVSFGREGLKTSSVGVRGLLRSLLEGIRTVELLTVGACYKTSSTAFVTLKSRVGKSSAHQLFLSHINYSMIVKSAPNPKDCIWSNISIPARQIEIRKTIADSCLIVGAVFWSIVVGFITAIANLESISKELPWLNSYRNTIIYEVLNQYLAVALLLILLSILPFIFDLIARSYEGRKLESEIQNSIMTRYFYYQLANVFVSVGLGSIANSMHQIIQNPSSILSILGTSLPSLSVYFTNLLIVKTFTAAPLEILRIWPLICVLSVRSCQDKNKCTIRELKRGGNHLLRILDAFPFLS